MVHAILRLLLRAIPIVLLSLTWSLVARALDFEEAQKLVALDVVFAGSSEQVG